MKLFSKVFKTEHGRWDDRWIPLGSKRPLAGLYPVRLCNEGVRVLFDVPYEAKRIRFTAHNKPANHRLKLEWPKNIERYYPTLNGDEIVLLGQGENYLAKHIFKGKRRVAYIQAEYSLDGKTYYPCAAVY